MSAGIGAAGNAVSSSVSAAMEGAGKFANFAAQAGISAVTSYTTSAANSAINSFYIGENGLAFDGRGFGKSLYSGSTKNSPSWKILETRRNYFLSKIGSSSQGTYITGDGYNTYYYDVNFLQKKLNLKRGQ